MMDENHFKDFEYEFDYCIIHKEKDFDYFPFKITLEGNNVIYIDRKDLASMYRKNQIKF